MFGDENRKSRNLEWKKEVKVLDSNYREVGKRKREEKKEIKV